MLRKIDEIALELCISRSELITWVLEEKFGKRRVEEGRYPTALWRLRSIGYLKYRTPKYPYRRMRGNWIVEEVRE